MAAARMVSLSRSVAWLLGVMAVGAFAPRASAFCRTTTADPPTSTCPATCTTTGTPLYWLDNKISYAFNVRPFAGLSDAQLRATWAASFQTWLDVTCNGESPGFKITQEAATTTLEEGPKELEPNTNAVVYYDATTWVENDHSPAAYAVTSVWYNTNSGRIYGADFLFNGGMGPYGDCTSTQCGTVGAPRTDLQNVATHEIGHFFGLAHSEVDGSTMACDAKPGEVSKRTLDQDDIEGFCDAYPPGLAFARDTKRSKGCSLGDSPAQGATSLLLLALALVRRKKR